MWALYARAAEQNRPAVAMSLSELIEDFRRAETTSYRLLDAAYSYRHQQVVTSQLDRRKLEQHWAEAGAGYGQAIMRRVSEINGAIYLTLFETGGNYEKRRGDGL